MYKGRRVFIRISKTHVSKIAQCCTVNTGYSRKNNLKLETNLSLIISLTHERKILNVYIIANIFSNI